MEKEPTKKWNSDLKPQPRLGIFGIFRESFKIIKRNGKLLGPVLLLVFLIFSQLEFAQTYLLQPVVKNLSSQSVKKPKQFQDFYNNNVIRELLLVEFLNLIFSSIISLVFLVATVSSSSEAYTGKVLALKEMVITIKKSLKNPIFTSFYLILFTLGAIFACIFSIGIFSIFAVDSWAYLLYGVLFLSILVLWFLVGAFWILSLVVSVLENVGGLDAIARAGKLMKGKKIQASMIMMLVTVTYGLFQWITDTLTSYNLDIWSRLAVSIPLRNGLICALKLFVFVVFTVFYHEMKASYDEKETKGLYVPIVAAEV